MQLLRDGYLSAEGLDRCPGEHRRSLGLTGLHGPAGLPLEEQQPEQGELGGVGSAGSHPRPRVAPDEAGCGPADPATTDQIRDREESKHKAAHIRPGRWPHPEPVA
jgi:hypothetical protein